MLVSVLTAVLDDGTGTKVLVSVLTAVLDDGTGTKVLVSVLTADGTGPKCWFQS